jgi:hypothetical protein
VERNKRRQRSIYPLRVSSVGPGVVNANTGGGHVMDQEAPASDKHQPTKEIHRYADASTSPTASKHLDFFREMLMKQAIQSTEKFLRLIIVEP